MRRRMTNWVDYDPWVIGVLEPILLLLCIALIGAVWDCSDLTTREPPSQCPLQDAGAALPKTCFGGRESKHDCMLTSFEFRSSSSGKRTSMGLPRLCGP